MAEKPDKVVVHLVVCCRRCGRLLRKKAILGYDRRQVVEIPP